MVLRLCELRRSLATRITASTLRNVFRSDITDRLYSAKDRRPATWNLMEVHFRYRRSARRCTDRIFVSFTDIAPVLCGPRDRSLKQTKRQGDRVTGWQLEQGAVSFDQASQLHDIFASRLAAPSVSSCEVSGSDSPLFAHSRNHPLPHAGM